MAGISPNVVFFAESACLGAPTSSALQPYERNVSPTALAPEQLQQLEEQRHMCWSDFSGVKLVG
jgi:hypothetical protein